MDEVIIISDMYDLNEYMALDLLCTGKLIIIFLISVGSAHSLWYFAGTYFNQTDDLTEKYLNVSFQVLHFPHHNVHIFSVGITVYIWSASCNSKGHQYCLMC